MKITNQKLQNEYYEAVKERNSNFIGTFFFGVKTTKIFCIPSCRAKTPKKENVIFNTSSKNFLEEGFRPCKICNPTENAYEPPNYIIKALNLFKKSENKKITDAELKKNFIQPERVRRWFKKHHGITFQTYQRMLKINNAFNTINKGEKIITSAYQSGYNSLSGFNSAFKKIIGNSPKDSNKKNIILAKRFTSPLGIMLACASEKGICLLKFIDNKNLDKKIKNIQNKLNNMILLGENEHLLKLEQELGQYFSGKLKKFTVKLDFKGTIFQKQVWEELLKIPYGKTISYLKQAKNINNEKAVRAVANANGKNEISIVVPCHRVIGSDGKLGGFSSGIERKKWLLNFENNNK